MHISETKSELVSSVNAGMQKLIDSNQYIVVSGNLVDDKRLFAGFVSIV